MKRKIALLLAALMMVGMLAACGAKEESKGGKTETTAATEPAATEPATEPAATEPATEPAATEPATEPAVEPQGELLDAPEKVYDDSYTELSITYAVDGAQVEITLKQESEDFVLLYLAAGLTKEDEVVYEISTEGYARYEKVDGAFVLDTESSAADMQQELVAYMDMISLLTMTSESFEGVQYRKINATGVAMTGEAYVYELVEEGVTAGRISIDKATGIMVDLQDAEGNTVLSVSKIVVDDVQIPAYK